MMDFSGPGTRIGPDDLMRAAGTLGCEVPAVQAVLDVETGGSGGCLADGRPKILFEAHVFGRLTGNRWTSGHPNISAPKWNRALYGEPGAHQYDRLAEAMALDASAALQSASWGLGQVLGANYRACGFTDPASFALAQCTGEPAQLDTFVQFLRSMRLDEALRDHNWPEFARRYNGSQYVANSYDVRLAAAYAKHAGHTLA